MISAAAIQARDTQRCSATIALDLSSLQDLFSEQLVWVHSSSIVDSKVSLLNRFAEGTARCFQITPFDVSIRIIGTVGIATGVVDMDAEWEGVRKAGRSRFTSVWSESFDRIQLLSWHSCRLP